MPQPDIRLKKLVPIRALTLRFIAENHLHFARAVAEIRATLRVNSIRGTGYPIQTIYADTYRQENVDSEFAIPIDDSWTADLLLPTFGTMIMRELPAVDAATYLVTGSPDTLNNGLADLHHWVTARGYKLGGSIRLVYLRGFVVLLPVEERMFEVQHPLDKA